MRAQQGERRGSEMRVCVDISVIEAGACSKLDLISRGQLSREKEAARSRPLG